MNNAIKILRVVPQQGKYSYSINDHSQISCVLEFSKSEIPLNTVFELQNSPLWESQPINLILEEVTLFNKKLPCIPIGVRVLCKLTILNDGVFPEKDVQMDSEGYLDSDCYLVPT